MSTLADIGEAEAVRLAKEVADNVVMGMTTDAARAMVYHSALHLTREIVSLRAAAADAAIAVGDAARAAKVEGQRAAFARAVFIAGFAASMTRTPAPPLYRMEFYRNGLRSVANFPKGR